MTRTYGRAWLAEGVWHIDAEPHVHLRLKRIFGKVSHLATGQLTLSNTTENCRDLAWVLERYPLALNVVDKAALRRGAKTHVDTLLRLERIADPSHTPQTFTMRLPLRSYQAREVEIYLSVGGLLNGDDVGLGKTAMAVGSLTDPRTLPAVVVTLTHLPPQWLDEVAKFLPDLRVHMVKRGTPYQWPTFFGGGPDVVVLNYHKLAGWSKTLSSYARSVIFDEVQELRHSGSQRYTAAQELAAACSFRLGLSATPIYNYGGEIYNIVNVLRPDALGTRAEFNLEWCQGGAHDEKARLKDPKAFGAWAREQFIMVRHTRAEVGRELPGVIKIPHRIDADAEALDRVENTAAELAKIILSQGEAYRGEKMNASEQLSVMLRQATGIAKAPYVADFVRLLLESEEKVVLCGWHREVYDIWASKLADLTPVMYTGSESATQKEAAKTAFISGDARVLILSLRSGAGMNGLQDVCSAIVFGELDWSPGVHEQCIGRLARDGQTSPVVAYFLAAEDGADPLIAEILGLKREQVDGIRNPTVDTFEQLQTDTGRTRRLAEFYLKRLGHDVAPAADETESVA